MKEIEIFMKAINELKNNIEDYVEKERYSYKEASDLPNYQSRRFMLNRKVDVNGNSGTGIVVEGIVFPNGRVVLGWITGEVFSATVYDSIEDVVSLHGHDGATELIWVDE